MKQRRIISNFSEQKSKYFFKEMDLKCFAHERLQILEGAKEI